METAQHPAKQRGHEAERVDAETQVSQSTAALAELHADLVEWLRTQEWSDFAQSLARFADAHGGWLSPKQTQAALSMRNKIEARDMKVSAQGIPDVGFYSIHGVVVRVQKARQSDNLYTKTLDKQTREWHYTGRAPFAECTPDNKLTLDEAKAHGLAHGWCLICTRELSDPVSVEQGIGPVCIKRIK